MQPTPVTTSEGGAFAIRYSLLVIWGLNPAIGNSHQE